MLKLFIGQSKSFFNDDKELFNMEECKFWEIDKCKFWDAVFTKLLTNPFEDVIVHNVTSFEEIEGLKSYIKKLCKDNTKDINKMKDLTEVYMSQHIQGKSFMFKYSIDEMNRTELLAIRTILEHKGNEKEVMRERLERIVINNESIYHDKARRN